MQSLTAAEIRILAQELGYSISGSNKAALVTSFLSAQAAACPIEVSVKLASSPIDPIVGANNALVDSCVLSDGALTITVDPDALSDAESEPMGTHKWVALDMGTGLKPLTNIKYNGDFLTAADVEEAEASGCREDSFVLYIATEVVAEETKTITIGADGYDNVTITIDVVTPD